MSSGNAPPGAGTRQVTSAEWRSSPVVTPGDAEGPYVQSACLLKPPHPYNGTNATVVRITLRNVFSSQQQRTTTQSTGTSELPLFFNSTFECETQSPVCCNVTGDKVRGVALGLMQINLGNVWQGDHWYDGAISLLEQGTKQGQGSLLLTADVGTCVLAPQKAHTHTKNTRTHTKHAHTKHTPSPPLFLSPLVVPAPRPPPCFRVSSRALLSPCRMFSPLSFCRYNNATDYVWEVRGMMGAFPSCGIYNRNNIPLAPFGPVAVSEQCRQL